MVKALSVTWNEGVTESESQILLDTVEQVLKWLYFRRAMAFFDPPIVVRAFGNWVIPALMDHHPYWGIQWYVEHSFDQELQRVIAPVYLELVRREPWQKADPHWDLTLLDSDLTEFPGPLARLRRQEYALGASFPGTAAVLSLHRLRTLTDPALQGLALARLVRHHLGHVLAIPPFERQEHVARRGLEMHCTNRCAMRHADSLEQLVDYAVQEAGMGWPFCPLCTQGLHSVVLRHTQDWN